MSWSADSRWIAFEKDQENRHTAIALYDTREAKLHQVTSGFFDDDQPTFDPDGKYLFYRTKRWFDPLYSEHEPSWIYVGGHALVAVPLRKDVPSPVAPRNDEEPGSGRKTQEPEKKPEKPAEEKKPENTEEPKKEEEKKAEVAIAEQKPVVPLKPGEVKPPDAAAKPEEKKPKTLEIDLDDFEARAVVLPPTGPRFGNLRAVAGKLIFSRHPRAGASGPSPLLYYDLEKREEKTIIDDAGNIEVSADGKKLLVTRQGQWGIIGVAENQKLDKALPTGALEAVIDPLAGMAADLQRCLAHRARLFLRPCAAPRPLAEDARTLCARARASARTRQ